MLWKFIGSVISKTSSQIPRSTVVSLRQAKESMLSQLQILCMQPTQKNAFQHKAQTKILYSHVNVTCTSYL